VRRRRANNDDAGQDGPRDSAASAEAQMKLHLAQAINGALQGRGLKQKEAARLLQIRQPKISALANYRLTGFSLERLQLVS